MTVQASHQHILHSPSKKSSKRRYAHGYQFITVTDLSQFKDYDVIKKVHSQAMGWYKRQPPKQSSKEASSGEHVPGTTIVSLDARVTSPGKTNYSAVDRAPLVPHEDRHAPNYAISPGGGGGVASQAKDGEKNEEDEKTNTTTLLHPMASRLLSSSGDANHASMLAPRFQSPQLDSELLMRNCLQAFVPDARMVNRVPSILGDARLVLSSTLIASTWLDMQNGHEAESLPTQEVKSRVLAMTRAHLRDQKEGTDDASMMVYINLLMGEIWNFDPGALRDHQNALAECVLARGGMDSFPAAPIFQVGAVCCYHCDLLCGTPTLPVFEEWEPLHRHADLRDGTLPPSPLFWHSLAQLEPGPLSQMLCDMCHLGHLFLSRATLPGTPLYAAHHTPVTDIVSRLHSLPSAFTSEHAMTGHWMYETCRMAAMLYAGALFHGISVCEAANPLQNSIYLQFLKQYGEACSPPASSLSRLLFEALQLSNSVVAWEKFPDIFYWVCAVGAMSARTSGTAPQTEQARHERVSHTNQMQRWFNMHATRSLLAVVFGEPRLVGAALKKLLVLQRFVTLPT